MAQHPQHDTLPPNNSAGFHQRRSERIEQKCIEIGMAKFQDFITDSILVDCDIRIHCSARAVNLFGSTFEGCTFRPRREMKNLRFTGMTLRGCTFLGKYTGCRFGNELPEHAGEVRDCDFSRAGLLHLCDFLTGSDVGSLRWPQWPHVVVTDLERTAKAWRELELPEELRIIQEVIAGGPPAKAATIFLPAETAPTQQLREVLATQSYILLG